MTAGQSLKVHIDGDGPGCPSPCPAAPGPALCSHSLCLALPRSSQQVFLEDTPTQGCSLNSYKSFQHNKYLCLPGPGEMVVNKQRKGLCPHSTHRLKQWILEHLAMSGDIFDCHNLGRRHLEQWTPTFLAPGTSFMEDSFSMSSSALYLFHTLFLLLLCQLYLRSSGIRSQRLGTADLEDRKVEHPTMHRITSYTARNSLQNSHVTELKNPWPGD